MSNCAAGVLPPGLGCLAPELQRGPGAPGEATLGGISVPKNPSGLPARPTPRGERLLGLQCSLWAGDGHSCFELGAEWLGPGSLGWALAFL